MPYRIKSSNTLFCWGNTRLRVARRILHGTCGTTYITWEAQTSTYEFRGSLREETICLKSEELSFHLTNCYSIQGEKSGPRADDGSTGSAARLTQNDKVLVGNLSEADSRKSMTASIITGATASRDGIPHHESALIYLVFQLGKVRESSRFVGD
ncbi:uncharacterized protein LACBIDRAFT_327529 [Laccaria bicolor S238N-H82]|uniref:Predicted protein n=1 Tax=Laccaria bicolor (strain S238N-H82 / ATCC MYA-4686) TaxID=486041 RepID=B0DC10_LACBS|nr:uncharacterized protein LACBIDRAFT_327529 [Laccaria bicolor S238N-H82]EDR07814.1 predicted protein [Laccaria bicolor S238N-H82]|eukprot:XP_001881603.1 predicted protein [Laccaria bicolor S238N-H82]